DYKIYEAVQRKLQNVKRNPRIQKKFENFCKKHDLECDFHKAFGVPSLMCIRGGEWNAMENEPHLPRWVLANQISNDGMVVLRAVKMELDTDSNGPIIEPGNLRAVDVKIEWRTKINAPVISFAIRDHHGKVLGHQDFYLDS